MISTVRMTKSGLFVRQDADLGLFVFSPFTGLMFCCSERIATDVLAWLDKRKRDLPYPAISQALGRGWRTSWRGSAFAHDRLLPAEDWKGKILGPPRQPLVINWFLTGMCPLACKYCYAEDLMRGNYTDADPKRLRDIAESILSYHPVAVVLTGGDPLVSRALESAMSFLHKRTGIVLDTSGYTLDQKHVVLFRQYGVAVRVSFDSERPRVNQAQRKPLKVGLKPNKDDKYSLVRALNAICMCLATGVPVTVQSVVTRQTANDLVFLGDKLYRLGVHSWRVMRVAKSAARLNEVKTIQPSDKLYRHVFANLIKEHNLRWKDKMALQITHNEVPNAVVLVGPDGRFWTESNVNPGKAPIDDQNRTRPRLASFAKNVDMNAHARRYLGALIVAQQ